MGNRYNACTPATIPYQSHYLLLGEALVIECGSWDGSG